MESATTTPPPTPAPQAMPTPSQQMANAAAALGRFVSSGGKLVDVATLALRESVCIGCDQHTPTPIGWRCKACGCHGWTKMRIATEACPQGKWPATVTP